MRKTKKQLEESNTRLESMVLSLQDKIYKLEQELEAMKKFSAGGLTSSLVISAEKIADSASHLVNDARQMMLLRR